MFENKTETEAREQILNLVSEYCDTFHNRKKPFEEGDRIPYASRVYDHSEMVNLVDSALEFWLTSGRYTDAVSYTHLDVYKRQGPRGSAFSAAPCFSSAAWPTTRSGRCWA